MATSRFRREFSRFKLIGALGIPDDAAELLTLAGEPVGILRQALAPALRQVLEVVRVEHRLERLQAELRVGAFGDEVPSFVRQLREPYLDGLLAVESRPACGAARAIDDQLERRGCDEAESLEEQSELVVAPRRLALTRELDL